MRVSESASDHCDEGVSGGVQLVAGDDLNVGHEERRLQPRASDALRDAQRRHADLVHDVTVPRVVDIPRDRHGSFDPQLIAKYQRRFPAFDEKIVSMYARGMSTREIAGHLEELYGIEVSPDLISTVTDAELDEIAIWQARPLEPVYPLVFFDALLPPDYVAGRPLLRRQAAPHRRRRLHSRAVEYNGASVRRH